MKFAVHKYKNRIAGANSRERISRRISDLVPRVSARVEERGAARRSFELLVHRVFQSALSKDRVTSNPSARNWVNICSVIWENGEIRAPPRQASKKHPPPQNFIWRKSDSKVFASPYPLNIPSRREARSFILDNGEQKGFAVVLINSLAKLTAEPVGESRTAFSIAIRLNPDYYQRLLSECEN